MSVASTAAQAAASPTCPICASAMVKRSSQRGEFFGCSMFPNCRGTRQVNEDPSTLRTAKYEPIRMTDGSGEQEAIWKSMKEDDSHIVISAGPGTGKSFSLVQGVLRLPKSMSIRGIAFNKHIADEMSGKLGASGCMNAQFKTCHSAGNAVLRSRFKAFKVDSGKMRPIFEKLSPEPQFDKAGWRRTLNLAARLAAFVKNYLVDYKAPGLYAEMERIADHHGLDFKTSEYRASKYDKPLADLAQAVDLLPRALDMCKQQASAVIDYDDMVWLPLVLDLPFERCDMIMGDEEQDSNAVQHEFLMRMGEGARIVVVGDPHQCQPTDTVVYKTGVGYVPIQTIKVGDEMATYSDGAIRGLNVSGRKVLAVAKRKYDGRMIDIKAGGFQHSCTPEHRCVFRMAKKNGWAVYICKRGKHARVGMTRNQSNPAGSVSMRARQSGAEQAWILDIFEKREDAALLEARIAYQYGIPMLGFSSAWDYGAHEQSWFDAFWKDFPDNTINMEKVLNEHGRDYRHPFWSITKNGGARGTKHCTHYSSVTQACNLISGWMRLCTTNTTGRYDLKWETVRVSSRPYKGYVYSLQLKESHLSHPTYVSQGIVTHNSIYGFRGSHTDSMNVLTDTLRNTPRGVREFPLTITRRCPKMHVMLAARLYPGHIRAMDDAPMGVIDTVKPEAAHEVMRLGDLVLCRVNKELMSCAYRLIRRGVRPHIKGRDFGKGIMTFLETLVKLCNDAFYGGSCVSPPAMENMVKALDMYRRDEMDKLLPLGDRAEGRIEQLNDKCSCMSEMIANSKSVAELRDRITSLFGLDSDEDPKASEVVTLGTIHRTKGLEATRVFVLAPELIPHPAARKAHEIEQETHCAWIAATRAKFSATEPGTLIFCGGVPPIFNEPATEMESNHDEARVS